MGIFEKLFGKNKKQSSDQNDEQGRYMPKENIPIDEQFTINFMKNGGKFIYCDSLSEIHQNFNFMRFL